MTECESYLPEREYRFDNVDQSCRTHLRPYRECIAEKDSELASLRSENKQMREESEVRDLLYDAHHDLVAGQFPAGTVCVTCGEPPLMCVHRDPNFWCSYHESHRFIPNIGSRRPLSDSGSATCNTCGMIRGGRTDLTCHLHPKAGAEKP